MLDGIGKGFEVWSAAVANGKSAGRGSNGKTTAYGVKKLRELILELAFSGKLLGNVEERGTWKWRKLEDYQPEFQNGASSRGDSGGSPITVLRLADIEQRTISLTATREVSIDLAQQEKYRLQKGDILITRVNGSADIVGTFIPVEEDLDAIYCDHFIRMRIAQDLVSSRFLALLGDAPLVREQIKGLFVSTAGQKTVNQKHIRSLRVYIPPLAEQHRIVAKVDELMALCDALEAEQRDSIAAHERLVECLLATLTAAEDAHATATAWNRIAGHVDTLFTTEHSIDQLKQTILQLAVMGKLVPQDPADEPASITFPQCAYEGEDEQPKNAPHQWLSTRLGLLGEWRGGGTPTKSRNEFWQGEIPWVSPKDMKVLRISDAQDHISEMAVEGSSVRLIPKGSFLMVVRGMILAHTFPVALTGREVTINQDMKALTLHYQELDEYLLVALQASQIEMLSKVKRSTHGTCKLQTEILENFGIDLPPLAEQRRIVAKVDELMALCDALKTRLSEAQTTQIHLADAVVGQSISK